MSQVYQPYASLAPSKIDSAYIYALVQTFGNGLAAITSAGELVVVDRQNLTTTQLINFDGVPTGANCLVSGDKQGQNLLCSGTHGIVATFDLRLQKKVAQFQIDQGVTALASDGARIAVGTEFKSQQAIVGLWDARQNKQIWRNAENNDEITAVSFHPNRGNILLAGGDDGLVSLFDTNIAEEEDSLMQVINHGPIHKAGFLGDNRIFALSSDQNLAVYAVSTPGDEEDPVPTLIGDLRPQIPCQYVIDVLQVGQDYVIAAGTNIGGSRVDLVRLANATSLSTAPAIDNASKHSLIPAHGEEVVRAIVIDDQAGVVFSGGEDGQIRAFRLPDASAEPEPKAPKPAKHKKTTESRYKPY